MNLGDEVNIRIGNLVLLGYASSRDDCMSTLGCCEEEG